MPASSPSALAALAALERRYDGAIPDPARRAALAGSAGAALRRQAAAEARLFAALVRGQVRAIRLSRARGPVPPEFAADLALYRAERRRWLRLQNEAVNPPSTVST